MCEFCENQGPSPGLMTMRGLDVILANHDTLSREGESKSRRYELRPAERGKTRGEVFRTIGGEQRRKRKSDLKNKNIIS